jgi:tetratricopeptide (TPR) repeat protein
MKRNYFKIALLILIASQSFAQLTMPSGANKKAMVAERIGITHVQINYNRPLVNGREGHIWGELVHYGFADLHYGTSKAAPWRAGANENTTIEFSTEVMIEGKPLPAGKYGFFIAMGTEKATLIFSKANNAWGSFYYDEKDDALRVEVPVQKINESRERLSYEFSDPINDAATVSLLWEKVKIPFKITVDLPKLQIASFRNEINSGAVYQYWQNMQTAAHYCLVNNINLEEGLSWADRSINTFFGEANFKTLSTYAGLLEKLDRVKEADSVMVKAIPLGKITDLFQYGFELCKAGKAKEAFAIFQKNYDKDPANDYSILGLALGNYALKNNKLALEFAKKGRGETVDSGFKSYYSTLISNMEAGKDVFK